MYFYNVEDLTDVRLTPHPREFPDDVLVFSRKSIVPLISLGCPLTNKSIRRFTSANLMVHVEMIPGAFGNQRF